MCTGVRARKSADELQLFWIEIPQFRATVRNSGISFQIEERFLNFVRPRKIEESRSKKLYYISTFTSAQTAHICLYKAKELTW